jgi:diguanylate cyclase (GGDEF)-like protein
MDCSSLTRRWIGLALTALLLLGAAPRVEATEPAATYVVTGKPATQEEQTPPCLHERAPDRTRLLLPAPAGGWSGHPQAVLVTNVLRGEVEIRHGARERCGTPQDYSTLDSRFLSGMGTVLVPQAGNRDPIEVEFDPTVLPLWRPLVRLGEPAPVQRLDAGRYSLRVAAIAIMFTLLLSAMLTWLGTRERAFMVYGLESLVFGLWLALISGLWARPKPWIPLGELAVPVMLALPIGLIGVSLRLIVVQTRLVRQLRWLDPATRWLARVCPVLALGTLLLPMQALGPASVVVEIVFYLLCLGLCACSIKGLAQGARGGMAALTSVAPFLAIALLELTAPALLALWKVELMMLAGCWMKLTMGMVINLRLGSLRQQRDEMRILAQTDALTGLPNRRAALEALATAYKDAQRRGRLLSVAFLDLDHFKAINDRYGHEAGDRVLEYFAQTLRTVFRGSDYVARMGGEEFLIVLPGAHPRHAVMRIDMLRTLMGTAAASLDMPDLRLTVSGGVTGLLPDDAGIVSILQRADAAMYAAKHAGRDRVELASTA